MQDSISQFSTLQLFNLDFSLNVTISTLELDNLVIISSLEAGLGCLPVHEVESMHNSQNCHKDESCVEEEENSQKSVDVSTLGWHITELVEASQFSEKDDLICHGWNPDVRYADEIDCQYIEPEKDYVSIKHSMIVHANTIVYPEAVMVQPAHTAVAVMAVPTLHGSKYLASRAQIILLEVFVQLQEANTFRLFNETGVLKTRHKESTYLTVKERWNDKIAWSTGMEWQHDLA